MDKIKILNSNQLKMIAVITMVIDHLLKTCLIEDNLIFVILGRISFPIFAFCVAEGIFYTHDKKRYFLNLFVFALLSEIPMDFVLSGGIDMNHQNVLFTFSFAVLAVIGFEYIKKIDGKGYFLYDFIFLLFILTISMFLCVDYDFLGVLLVLIFYFSKRFSFLKSKFIITIALVLFCGIIAFPLQGFSQIYGIAAIPILYLYNGEKGKKNNVIKYIFYGVYPIHFIILIILKGVIL